MLINLELVLNILLHIFILFILLYIFFWTFIFKNQINAVNREIEDVSNTLFTKIKDTFNDEQRVQIGEKINEVTPLLNILENNYNKKNRNVIAVNNCIQKTNRIAIYSILVLILVVYLITKYMYKSSVDLGGIIKENLLTLSIIGLIEYSFFKEIASRFTPVSPGFISRNFFQYLQKKFNYNTGS